jgi:capsular exopolysaccharide synthesis family protein
VREGSEVLNIERALRVVWRRAPIIAICVLVVAGAAFLLAHRQPKEYTASAALSFDSEPLSQQVAGLPTAAQNVIVQRASNLELVRRGSMATTTATGVGHGLTAASVAASISVTAQGESNVVGLSAKAKSPQLAAAIANSYANAFVSEQRIANKRDLQSALALVRKQLAAVPRGLRASSATAALQAKEQTLELLSGLHYGDVALIQEAIPPSGPSSPETFKDTALGAALGLLLGLALMLLLERVEADGRLREASELEQVYELPLLGAIPEASLLSRLTRRGMRRDGGVSASQLEPFRMVRAQLRARYRNRELRTLLVTSSAPGGGKTTFVKRMAEAAAGMGARVLLIDADLRRPSLASSFDFEARLGLSEVLAGTVSIEHAVQTVFASHTGEAAQPGGSLDLLSAGAELSQEPSAAIESPAMSRLLSRAHSAYDLILIDTPSLTVVSDAFPLLDAVDGVIVVARLRHERRAVAERLREILQASGASLLGVVANGSRSAVAAAYGREYGLDADLPPLVTLSGSTAASSAPAQAART